MRACLSAFVLILVVQGAGYVVATAQTTKYGVTVEESRPDALAKVKTYTWTAGQPSTDKTVDQQIIAAVDRELKALGLTKLATGQGDARVTYASQRRTDADEKAKPSATGALPTYAVGVLVVQLRESASGQMLFNAKVNSPIDVEPAKLEAAINAAATALFEQYPGRAPVKR